MRYLSIALLLICATASASSKSEKPLETAPAQAQVTVNDDPHYLEAAIKSAGSREAAARIEIARGWKQLKQGDLEVAAQSFTMAYKLDPKNVEVYWGLGNTMTQQGRYVAATTYYERATKIDPHNAKLMADVGLSQTYSAYKSTSDPEKQKERVQQAMQWFDSAEKIDPNRAIIYANRAIALYILKDYAGAWKQIEKAETLERDSVDKRFLADLTAKQARAPSDTPAATKADMPVKAEAVVLPTPVKKAEAPAPDAPPTTKLSPRIRDAAKAKNVSPAPAPAAATAARATPAVKAAPSVKAEAKTSPPVVAPTPAVQTTPVEAAPAPTEKAPAEKVPGAPKEKQDLRLKQGKTYPSIGKDKRDCLQLKTLEAIHRCVYPPKK